MSTASISTTSDPRIVVMSPDSNTSSESTDLATTDATPHGDHELLSDAAYRIGYRLTGLEGLALWVARSSTGEAFNVSDPLHAVHEVAVRAVLCALSVDDQPALTDARHAQHRARLRRELRRHDPSAQGLLACRFLLELSVAQVVRTSGYPEASVRGITSRWDSADDPAAGSMLGSIDTWTSTPAILPPTHSLDYLDAPA